MIRFVSSRWRAVSLQQHKKYEAYFFNIQHHYLVSYEARAIKYVWKNDEGTLRKSPSLTTLNAYLIKNQTEVCPEKGNWRGELKSLTL
jgi:hypothetical protein